MNELIEIHGARTGNCLRVSIALEEAQLPYTVTPVDLRQGQQREPAHLALNAAGKVPTLIDRASPDAAFVLSQSNAILLYIADKVPGKLMPVYDLQAKAIAYERFFYFLTDVIAPSHAAFRLRTAGVPSGSHILDEQALLMLKAAERFLLNSDYMAGDLFTLADIAAFSITRAYAHDINWRELPRLDRWYKNVNLRPAVQRGLQAFDTE